jgi:hypothetical protein
MSGIRRSISMLSLLSVVGALIACASKTSSVSTASGPARWAGTFRQSQTAATAVVGPATPGRSAGYGSITLTPVAGDSGRTRVELAINAPVPAGTQVGWAVFMSPCGSPTPPITGANEFPTIEIANSGSGTVRTVMSIRLDPRVTYHANIYWASQVTDVSNVMMCANLLLTSGR